jgi:hypothetical protein
MAINNSAPLITAIPIGPNASSTISRRRMMCKPRRVHFDPVAGGSIAAAPVPKRKGRPFPGGPPCGASAIREGIANPSPRPSAKLRGGVALDAPIRFHNIAGGNNAIDKLASQSATLMTTSCRCFRAAQAASWQDC